MNKIKELKLDNTNWLELNIENEEGNIIHCEYFGDSDEYISLLNQRCTEFGVELSEDNLNILAEQKSKRKVFTQAELDEIAKQNTIIDLQNKIQEAKAYLSSTAWIWEKYSRNVTVIGDITLEEFKLKYTDIISNQEQCRLDINKCEQDILQLQGAI